MSVVSIEGVCCHIQPHGDSGLWLLTSDDIRGLHIFGLSEEECRREAPICIRHLKVAELAASMDAEVLAQRMEEMALSPTWRRWSLDRSQAALCSMALRVFAQRASAIEARSDATGTGAAEGESAAREAGDAQ